MFSIAFFISDVLLEMKGLSPEDDDILDETEESFIPVHDDLSIEALFQEQLPENQSISAPTDKQQTFTDKKETNKLNKQVSWGDTKKEKHDSSESGDESSEEDEGSQNSKTVCEKCSAELCKCDSGVVALDNQLIDKEKDVKTGDDEKLDEKEMNIEARKFDGVFSDTDESEESAERYESSTCTVYLKDMP